MRGIKPVSAKLVNRADAWCVESTSGSDDPERGGVAMLVVGLMGILILLIATLGAITSLEVQQRRLLAVADSAAQAAVDGYTARGVTGNVGEAGTGEGFQTRGRERAQRVVDAHADAGAQLESVSFSGREAHVAVRGVARLPLAGWILPDGISVSAESKARRAER